MSSSSQIWRIAIQTIVGGIVLSSMGIVLAILNATRVAIARGPMSDFHDRENEPS